MKYINIARAAWNGNYHERNPDATPDCMIGQSMGMEFDEQGIFIDDPINHAIAQFAINKAGIAVPQFLQQEIAIGFRAITGKDADKIIQEHRIPEKYLDCDEVVAQAIVEMEKRGLERPFLATHAHLMERLAYIAIKQGLDPIVVAGAPNMWDSYNAQRRLHGRGYWIFREVPAVAYLGAKGKL